MWEYLLIFELLFESVVMGVAPGVLFIDYISCLKFR